MPALTEERTLIESPISEAREVFAGNAFRLWATADGFPGNDLTGAEFYMTLEFGTAIVNRDADDASKITLSKVNLDGNAVQLTATIPDQSAFPNMFYFSFASNTFVNPAVSAPGKPVPIALGILDYRSAGTFGNKLARFVFIIRRGVELIPPITP